MHRSHRLRAGGVFTVTALALLSAGCGDDGSSTDAGGGDGPGGEPIVLSVMGSETQQPELYDAAEAAVQSINDAGGIEDPAGGPNRPLEISTCDATLGDDPNGPLNCGRQAVDDDVLAVAGKLSNGPESVTVPAEAGIPLVGSGAFVPPDWEEPLSFPFAGGASTASAGLGVGLQEEDASDVTAFVIDTPARPAIVEGITAGLENGEDDLVSEIAVPLDTSIDLASLVADGLSAEPDGVAVVADTNRTLRVVEALLAAGWDGPIAIPALTINDAILEELGDATENLVIVGNFAAPGSDDPTIAEFNAEMDEHASDALRSEFAVNVWLAIHLIADVLPELDTIDRESLAEALQGRQIDDGAAPPYTLGENGIDFLPFERVPRATVQFQAVEDGEIVPRGDGEFVDLNEVGSGSS